MIWRLLFMQEMPVPFVLALLKGGQKHSGENGDEWR
jgi:hypothetical protein